MLLLVKYINCSQPPAYHRAVCSLSLFRLCVRQPALHRSELLLPGAELSWIGLA